jgi:uncharacterized RDD family membrane protein YckC
MSEKIDFSKRFASFFIDVLIILVITIAIGLPIGTSIRSVESQKKTLEISKNTSDSTQTAKSTEQFEIKSSNENPFLSALTGSIEKIRFGFEFGLGLIGLLYGLIEVFGAASPGKMVLNLRIYNDDKSQPNHSTLFLRYLIKNLTFVLFLVAGIWYLPIFERAAIVIALIFLIGMFRSMTHEGRTLIDIIFKTAVYDKNIISE